MFGLLAHGCSLGPSGSSRPFVWCGGMQAIPLWGPEHEGEGRVRDVAIRTCVIDHTSPTTSSRSASRSNSFTDEGSSGTGVHVSPAGSNIVSNQSDDSWEGVSSELDPSDSASRPPTSNTGYRDRPSRTSRVHRHPVPAPPSSVDPDDFPGYGRGYPTPQHGPYGGRMPLPGYAQSAYSQPGPYAPPPFPGPGALTHYGAQGGYGQYPGGGNPFSPQPTPGPPGGAGYFGAPHHAMSGHSTPGGYPGHDMMPYPPNPGYGGYGGHGGAMQGYQHYPPAWPPSEGSIVAVPDPETEKKLIAVTELMEKQKLEYDKLQKELADKAAAEAKIMADKIEKAQKELAEKAAKAQKEIDDRNAKEAAERAAMEAARKTAEEKAAWEAKMDAEKKQALADFEEAQRKATVAAAEQARKAAEEKAIWEKKVEEEKRQALLDFEAAQRKAAADAAAAAAKVKEEKDAKRRSEYSWSLRLPEGRQLTMQQQPRPSKKRKRMRGRRS
ncbi:hypothetical protein N431DRAFT_495957 [Stipitochalara longipes BDJ]|nr:hypothetical protein N431DRAFT_495957 [Stipitochalara longipes BDJ]